MKHTLRHPTGVVITFESAAPLQVHPRANPVPMMLVTTPSWQRTVCALLARLWWKGWLAEGYSQ